MPTTPTDIQVPDRLPVLPGIALSGRYLLTDVAPINRGDTLEAVRLPDGRVAMMVADVAGHGFSAAIATTQLRTVLRERLLESGDLADCLDGLHRLAAHVPEVWAARLAVAVLDTDRQKVDYVAAGHAPPLLWEPGRGARALGESRCRPLGCFGPVLPGVAEFSDSGALLLHTDGLTSGGVVPAERVTDRLDSELSRGVRRSTPFQHGDAVCANLVAAAEPPAMYLDDVAIILLQQIPQPRALRLTLPAVADSVASARTALSSWLEDIGAGLSDQIGLCHAAGELARNVVDHAYRRAETSATPRLIQLDAALEDDGRACVAITDEGRWHDDEGDGQGLLMASGLADELRIRRTARGTQVQMHQQLHRAVPLFQAASEHPSGVRAAVDGDLRTEVAPGRVTVSGVVDELNIEVFRSALREATRAGTADAVVDLAAVDFLASPGIQAILETTDHARRSGATVRFVAPPDSTAARILDLVDVPHTA